VQKTWGPADELRVHVEPNTLVVAEDVDAFLQVLDLLRRHIRIVGVGHCVVGNNHHVPVVQLHRDADGHRVPVLAVGALEDLHFEVSSALGGRSIGVDAKRLEVKDAGGIPTLGDVDIAPPVAPAKAGVVPVGDIIALACALAGVPCGREGQKGQGRHKHPPHGSVHWPRHST